MYRGRNIPRTESYFRKKCPAAHVRQPSTDLSRKSPSPGFRYYHLVEHPRPLVVCRLRLAFTSTCKSSPGCGPRPLGAAPGWRRGHPRCSRCRWNLPEVARDRRRPTQVREHSLPTQPLGTLPGDGDHQLPSMLHPDRLELQQPGRGPANIVVSR